MSWILSAFTDEAGPTAAEQIAACRRGGLTHVDLRSVNNYNIVDLPIDEARQVADQLAEADLKVCMFGSPIGKIGITDDVQIDLGRLDHLARLMPIFGTGNVRIFSYYNKTDLPKDQWGKLVLERLAQLRDRAADLGLCLYHENETGIFGDTSDDVLAIAELRDGETFKLIYDFANYIRTGEDGWSSWLKLRDITDAFHLKDQRHDGQHVPMGQGDTDSERILADAVARGWTGPCVLEPHLSHSKAVLATGVSGQGNAALADLSPADSFQIAVEAAKALLTEAGARV